MLLSVSTPFIPPVTSLLHADGMKQQYIVVVDHFRTEVPRTCGECPAGEECWEETQDFCPGARAPMPAWAIALIAACIVAAASTIILVARKARERCAREARLLLLREARRLLLRLRRTHQSRC